MMTFTMTPIFLAWRNKIKPTSSLPSMLTGALLAIVLSACSGTRELGPTYFIDADKTDYIEDGRDFPKLGKYDDMPPVISRPSNVLDVVKALPETVRSLRKGDEAVESEPDANMIRSDIPAAKPADQIQDVQDVETPANDIAKSLIGDLSSNTYTDPVPPGDVMSEMPVGGLGLIPVQTGIVADTLRFAPLPVVAKTLYVPKLFARDSSVSRKSDLVDLRQTIYLRKLNESSLIATASPRRLQFATSSVSPAKKTISRTDRLVAKLESNLSVSEDESFIVLGRINFGGIILSAHAGGLKPPDRQSGASEDQGKRFAQPISQKVAAKSILQAEQSASATREIVASLTRANSAGFETRFAAR